MPMMLTRAIDLYALRIAECEKGFGGNEDFVSKKQGKGLVFMEGEAEQVGHGG